MTRANNCPAASIAVWCRAALCYCQQNHQPFQREQRVINTLSEESAKRDAERPEKLPVPALGEERAALGSCREPLTIDRLDVRWLCCAYPLLAGDLHGEARSGDGDDLPEENKEKEEKVHQNQFLSLLCQRERVAER